MSLLSLALLLLTFVGLALRGRWRRLESLPVYLAATAAAQALVLLWPGAFFVWRAWVARELVLNALVVAIVAEITLRVFAILPRAARAARYTLAAVLALTLLIVALVPWRSGELASVSWLYVVVTEVLPRLAYGAGWLCLAQVIVMNRYRLPLDPLHKAVLLGLGAYLFVYAFGLGTQRGQPPTALVYTVTPILYTLMLAYWAWAAWRREPEPKAPPEVVRRLHPWR